MAFQSAAFIMGCFRAPPPWRKTAPLKRPIKRSMKTECTKPSHSQSVANFVANVHSQGIIAAARTKFRISFAKPFAFASEVICSLIRSCFFEIWWPKFASESPRRVNKIAFAFAAVSLRPRCGQVRKRTAKKFLQLLRALWDAANFREMQHCNQTVYAHGKLTWDQQSRCIVGGTKNPSFLAIFCSPACAHLLVYLRCSLAI